MSNKNEVAIVNNATKSNKLIDFTLFLNDINSVNEYNELVYGTKNNMQLALAKCGVMVNANSNNYVPRDAYVRFKNNTQFQLQYSASKNKFVGFNIRLCNTEHEKLFSKWFTNAFKTCNDNQRILVSDFIPLDNFNEVINKLITLEKYNRGVLVPTTK